MKQPAVYDDTDVSIRQVTIRQLILAEKTQSDLFKIDGKELKLQTKVVLIANQYVAHKQPNRIEYMLDDGTGRIVAHEWLHSDSSGGLRFEDYAYVRVTGTLEQYRGTKSIKVMKMTAVKEPHQIYHHILLAIFDTIATERGYPPHTSELYHLSAIQSTQEDISASTQDEKQQVRMENIPERPLSTLISTQNHSIQLQLQEMPDNLKPADTPPPNIIMNHKKKGKGKIPVHPPSDISSQRKESELNAEPAPHPHKSFDEALQQPSDHPKACNHSNTQYEKSSHNSSDRYRRLSPTLRNDPLSKLSNFQRDIILCIKHLLINEGHEGQSLYPSGGSHHKAYDKGVHIKLIIRTLQIHRPNLTLSEFSSAIESLVEEGHIYNPVDDHHYACIS